MVKVSTSATDEHEFHALGAKPFELFVQALHAAQEGIFSTNSYGENGYAQYGADHIAFRRTISGIEVEVGQSKAYKEFEQDGIKKAVDAFLLHWDAKWAHRNVGRFILFVGCNIKSSKAADEIITQTQRLIEKNVQFEVWDANGIYRRLPQAPSVVRAHLKQAWVEHIFGPPANPLTSIAADLVNGDFGAQSAAALVGQLNKAESERVAQLRRRVRMGEAVAVRRDVDQALNSSVKDALSPSVRADFMRLSAALHITGGTPELAKPQLDEADGLDGGTSQRLRAMLCLATLGPASTLESDHDATNIDVAEILAIAHLRQGHPELALAVLKDGLAALRPSAETLRIAGLAALAAGRRDDGLAFARRAVERDGESRACRHLLAMALFACSLAPSLGFMPCEWPVPFDQALVLASDQARSNLEEASRLLEQLAENPDLAEHAQMEAWAFAIRVCMPWASPSAEAVLTRLVEERRLVETVVAWSLARGMKLDFNVAREIVQAARVAKPDDLQLIVIDVALSFACSDHPRARSLLEDHHDHFMKADLASYHRYWSALLDIEGRRTPSPEALAQWPWLKLRHALKIKYKKKRHAEVARIAAEMQADDGDPLVLLACVQILFDAGKAEGASKFTDALVAKVGTPEAITLAAYVLYRAGRHDRVLSVLADGHAFPGDELPADLQRLRIDSMAALGHLVDAARELSDLAALTGATSDLWKSIEWNLAVGAVKEAGKLFVENRELLSKPDVGHVRLAHAAMAVDPQLAMDITRELSDTAPDELVSAAYELASKLRLNEAQSRLVKRLQALGVKGEAGVEIVTDIAMVIERIQERRKQVDELYEQYCNGHLPIHLLARFAAASFADHYLGNLVEAPHAAHGAAPIHARYGRRYDLSAWPEQREQISLVVDVSGLMTIHGLGLLDKAERAFRPLRVAPDVINAISAMRKDLTALQPERIDAARALMLLHDRELLHISEEEQPASDLHVHWQCDETAAGNHLNLSRLVAEMEAHIGADKIAQGRARLSEMLRQAPTGPGIAKDSSVVLEGGIALELEIAGLLRPLCGIATIKLAREQLDAARADVAQAERREKLAGSLEKLAQQIADGVNDGTYVFVPVGTRQDNDPLARQFFQCLQAMNMPGSILWVDDRYTTSFNLPTAGTATTVEVLDVLALHDRLDADAVLSARLRLRAAGWMFMPVEGTEIARLVTVAVKSGDVQEDDRLITLRRSTARMVLHRRRLQWPSPEQAEQGVQGEIPFLLDQGHAVCDALVRIWSDAALSDEDAMAASAWILSVLDMSAPPPATIPAGDPRSEFLIGLHLTQLLMLSLQISPLGKTSARRACYTQWLWEAVIGPRLQSYPQILPYLLEHLEHYFTDDLLEESGHSRFWKAFCGETINSLPDSLRLPLMNRPHMREAFLASEEGIVTLADHRFNAETYVRAIIDLAPGQKTQIATQSGGKAVLRLDAEKNTGAIVVTVKRKLYDIDPWVRSIGSPDQAVRREALKSQNTGLDLMPDALDQLALQLGEKEPVERVLHIMNLISGSMGGWYSRFETQMKSTRSFYPRELLPDDLEPLFQSLQLQEGMSLEEGQARTIAAVGLEEAIQRWSGLPIEPGQPFQDAVAALDDEGLLTVAKAFGRSSVYTRIFVARLLWKRATGIEALESLLRETVRDAGGSSQSDDGWRLLMACAQFTSNSILHRTGWEGRSTSHRLAAVWSHAGQLAQYCLNARLDPDPLIKFLHNARTSMPTSLFADHTGFAGDTANPENVIAGRLKIHAFAPLLADIGADEQDAELIRGIVLGMLSRQRDGKPVQLIDVSHGELTVDNALGSYLGDSLCPLLEPIIGSDIPLASPRLASMLDTMVRNEDPLMARHAWFRMRSAAGHGALHGDLAVAAKEQAQRLPDIFMTGDAVDDAITLLSFATIASESGWHDLGSLIDVMFDELYQAIAAEKSVAGVYLLEVAFYRAKLEEDFLQRAEILADRFRKLGRLNYLTGTVVDEAHRFAMAMPGSLAQPFVDVVAMFHAEA